MFRPLPRRLIAALLFVAPALVFPRWWCGRDAADWYAGKLETQAALAREVAAWVEGGVDRSDFRTGHPQYDGEWAFGTYQMAALGFVQVIRAHPEMRDEFLPDLRVLEANGDLDVTYQNFIYARSFGEGRFLAQALYLRIPSTADGVEDYHEVAVAGGVQREAGRQPAAAQRQDAKPERGEGDRSLPAVRLAPGQAAEFRIKRPVGG